MLFAAGTNVRITIQKTPEGTDAIRRYYVTYSWLVKAKKVSGFLNEYTVVEDEKLSGSVELKTVVN